MSDTYDEIDEQHRRALVEVLDSDRSEEVVESLEQALAKAEHEGAKYHIRNAIQKILAAEEIEDR